MSGIADRLLKIGGKCPQRLVRIGYKASGMEKCAKFSDRLYASVGFKYKNKQNNLIRKKSLQRCKITALAVMELCNIMEFHNRSENIIMEFHNYGIQ